jgi:hypothetical protein
MPVESFFESRHLKRTVTVTGVLDHLVHVYGFREFGTRVRQLEADEFQQVQCSCLLAHTHRGPSHHSLEPTRRETPTLALRILDFARRKIAVIGFCSREKPSEGHALTFFRVHLERNLARHLSGCASVRTPTFQRRRNLYRDELGLRIGAPTEETPLRRLRAKRFRSLQAKKSPSRDGWVTFGYNSKRPLSGV